MRVRRARRIWLAVVTFASFCLLLTGASIAARRATSSNPAALTSELHRLQHRREGYLSNLRVVKERQRRVKRELRQINTTLSQTEAHLSEVRQDVKEARGNLTQAVHEYHSAEARLSGHREDVSDRLVAIYELGEVRPLEVLLEATSFTDFMNRVYLLNQVVERDSELLDQFQAAEAAADQHRDNAAAEERKVSDLQNQVAAEKNRVSDWRDATQEKSDRIAAQRAAYERGLAELEENSRQVTAMLQRLERSRIGQSATVKPWRGGLVRPVEGRIVSGFGYRTHPIFRVRKMHTGIDIASPSGTPIHAAAGGSVVWAGRWGGYGNCVIVDHGGGLATLYAHCSRLAVGEGQTVKQGQTVGYVGSTGLATGPHLHFEVRRNGRPVDPAGF